ncbi:GTP cyclohydrolase II [Falsihalocynthiibacter arcticus]|uniref:GTP cyclohydrolase-2 n=1 Tax=Falsihalocynthiibacter arcticus TaxID=1579316 RepID=A0A126UXJ9_9RHOB|nr:GTP cyclohydrolase II [Falsihalocynthiibacter arcticus]AML50798.1 GTP cyclohydrolase [Falsihalocynthiibacter arcticus]
MPLTPTLSERLARARADLRMGAPIVLSKAGESALVIASETLTPARLSDLRELGGPLILAITTRRAETLKARAYDTNAARIVVPSDADTRWIYAVADPENDLRTPMKGPLKTLREGASCIAKSAIGLAKAARLLPSAVLLPIENGVAFAHENDLTHVPLEDAEAEIDAMSPLTLVASARVPLEVSEAGRLHVFRPLDGGEEHYAVEIGRPDRGKPVLSRLHSACFTGDLIGSLKCDCGPQLRAALAAMGENGAGVLLYLNQEGRGIGLANKMRAYSLQDQGFDTVQANHRLGFEDDERDFRIGAEILKRMGFQSVNLLTNNPVKVEMMQANGIQVVERVPLKVGENAHNHAYLATKAAKSGHLL